MKEYAWTLTTPGPPPHAGLLSILPRWLRPFAPRLSDYDSARLFLKAHFAELELPNTDIVIAGWGANGPAACVVSVANTGGEVHDVASVMVTPVVSPEVAERFASDPIGNLLKLVQHQADNNSSVGGWLNVTQVGPAVIETYTADRLYSPQIRAPLVA